MLVTGAILTPGGRTVTSALRAMGLSQTRQLQNYHRVLNRAHWSSLQASQVLLLLTALAPSERYQKQRAKQRHQHKTLVDWMRQSLLQVRRQVRRQQRLIDPLTRWTKVQVPRWYGGTLHKAHRKGAVEPRVVEIATDTAIWYHTGKVPVTLRWVLVWDPQGAFSPLCCWASSRS